MPDVGFDGVSASGILDRAILGWAFTYALTTL